MKLQVGNKVLHKASKQQMVVLVANTYGRGDEETINDSYKCRFLNEVTGIYELQEFLPFELEVLSNQELLSSTQILEEVKKIIKNAKKDELLFIDAHSINKSNDSSSRGSVKRVFTNAIKRIEQLQGTL